ncbi:hypothetical protein ACJX0J_038721, partial [Zea mays]
MHDMHEEHLMRLSVKNFTYITICGLPKALNNIHMKFCHICLGVMEQSEHNEIIAGTITCSFKGPSKANIFSNMFRGTSAEKMNMCFAQHMFGHKLFATFLL